MKWSFGSLQSDLIILFKLQNDLIGSLWKHARNLGCKWNCPHNLHINIFTRRSYISDRTLWSHTRVQIPEKKEEKLLLEASCTYSCSGSSSSVWGLFPAGRPNADTSLPVWRPQKGVTVGKIGVIWAASPAGGGSQQPPPHRWASSVLGSYLLPWRHLWLFSLCLFYIVWLFPLCLCLLTSCVAASGRNESSVTSSGSRIYRTVNNMCDQT